MDSLLLTNGRIIDPANQVRDPIGRPFAIAGLQGRPINSVFAG